LRDGARRERAVQLFLQPLARRYILGDDYDFRIRLVRRSRVHSKPEARRPPADITGVIGRVAVALQQSLGLFRRLHRSADGGTLRHAQLEEWFRPFRQREKLLLHMGEAERRQHEDALRNRPRVVENDSCMGLPHWIMRSHLT
jgi:hypothetical protein